MGSQIGGTVGQWMEKVERLRMTTKATVEIAGEDSRASAGLMYAALTATCQGTALTIVRRAGEGQGWEAWRQLCIYYEPKSKQGRVVLLIEVLSYVFTGPGGLMEKLEGFDAKVTEYEKETEKKIEDDLKVGVVIKNMEKGSLKEHLLLHAERCTTYESFRAELDTIARAQRAAMMDTQPMDLSALKANGGGKGGQKGGFTGKCDNCGKICHKRADCWAAKGGGKGARDRAPTPRPPGKPYKPGQQQKQCHSCGMTNHLKADCRASEEKKKKWKEQQAKKGGGRQLRELADDDEPVEDHFGCLTLCQVAEGSLAALRSDASDRQLTFAVDSAACTTVCNKDHPAIRGYKLWQDAKAGREYGTAKRRGAKIVDEGKRVLQTKRVGGAMPSRIHMRQAEVASPLMAVCDMVDANHCVVFDSSGSFAFNKQTNEKIEFERKGKKWNLTVNLEAPKEANRVATQILAELKESKKQNDEPTVADQVLASVVGPLGPDNESRGESSFLWATRPTGRV